MKLLQHHHQSLETLYLFPCVSSSLPLLCPFPFLLVFQVLQLKAMDLTSFNIVYSFPCFISLICHRWVLCQNSITSSNTFIKPMSWLDKITRNPQPSSHVLSTTWEIPFYPSHTHTKKEKRMQKYTASGQINGSNRGMHMLYIGNRKLVEAESFHIVNPMILPLCHQRRPFVSEKECWNQSEFWILGGS